MLQYLLFSIIKMCRSIFKFVEMKFTGSKLDATVKWVRVIGSLSYRSSVISERGKIWF